MKVFRDYFQEVKRVIFIDISALHGCLPNIHDLSIYSKNNKGLKTKFDSHFDAWIIVLGKQRPEVHTSLFKQNNPAAILKFKEIRGKFIITMKAIDRTVLQRYVIFAFLIVSFTFKMTILYTFDSFLKTCESRLTYLLHTKSIFHIFLSVLQLLMQRRVNKS